MTYADDLLVLAQSRPQHNTEAEARRSASTAYYAVFHLIVDTAVSSLVPKANLPAQNYARRMPTHTFLKATCGLLVPKPGQAAPIDAPKAWKEAGCSGSVAPAISGFAERVLALHAGRERADYDLANVFTVLDADLLQQQASEVFAVVRAGLPDPQWALFLTTVLLGQRRAA